MKNLMRAITASILTMLALSPLGFAVRAAGASNGPPVANATHAEPAVHSHAIREAIPTAGIRAETLIAQEESSQAQGDPDNPDDANADSAGGDNQPSDNGDQGNQPGFAAEPDQNAQSGDNGDNGDPGGDSSASQQDNSTASSDQNTGR